MRINFFSFLIHFAGLNLVFVCFLSSCSSNKGEMKGEQLIMTQTPDSIVSDTLVNSVGNLSFNEVTTTPNSVILTGMPEHRLVTVYKYSDNDKKAHERDSYYSSSYSEEDGNSKAENFMPGIEILYGLNLLNVAHYDLKSEKLNFFFNHPVLIKSLYYPSFIQDSLNGMPINRNYYLVSVYDEDTNKDTLINQLATLQDKFLA